MRRRLSLGGAKCVKTEPFPQRASSSGAADAKPRGRRPKPPTLEEQSQEEPPFPVMGMQEEQERADQAFRKDAAPDIRSPRPAGPAPCLSQPRASAPVSVSRQPCCRPHPGVSADKRRPRRGLCARGSAVWGARLVNRVHAAWWGTRCQGGTEEGQRALEMAERARP